MSAKQSSNILQYIAIGRSESLVMTDYWFLFGMWVVVFWAVDPFGGYMDLIPVIKHLPVFVIAPAFILAIISGFLFKDGQVRSHPSRATRNLIFNISLFSGFVTIGSVISRVVYGVDNTFLTMGLFSLMAPVTFWFFFRSPTPIRLAKGLLFVYLFWALVAITVQLLHFGTKEIFHNKEHLVIAVVSAFYFFPKPIALRILAILFIAACAILGHKNTAYLTAVLIFGVIFAIWALPHSRSYRDPLKQLVFWGSVLLLTVMTASTLFLTRSYGTSVLPTGNPEYRLRTYENAWNKFQNSPVFGTGFTGPAAERFDLFTVSSTTQILPTHSDPLDILANGGLLGIILWAAIYVTLAKRWFRIVLMPERLGDPAIQPYLHTLFCVTFSGFFVCAFNPILNTPNLAWAYWAIVGALIALLDKSEILKSHW